MPEAVERGGYLPIPRRNTRAGSGYLATQQRSRTGRSGPKRPLGSESLSVRDEIRSDEQSVKQSARNGRVQAMRREEPSEHSAPS